MSKSRREFLNASIRAGAAMSALAHPGLAAALALPSGPSTPVRSARGALSILILGGTSFIGPHVIAYAMNRMEADLMGDLRGGTIAGAVYAALA